MPGTLIDGRTIAAQIRSDIRSTILREHIKPGLAVIMVGDHAPSTIYVTAKVKACNDVGIKSTIFRLPQSASEAELLTCIDALNDNPDVHGILLQLPLPEHFHVGPILERIAPHKDVDGLHPHNLGLVLSGRANLIPCTPQGVMHLIHHIEQHITGLSAVVVGCSMLVGRPLGQLLLDADCTLTHVHSKTPNIAQYTRDADILVVAAGSPGLITSSMVKPGAIVIDVGITRTENGIVGDVCFNDVKNIARAITPVPGGVGPMTIACLLKNTLLAAQNH